MKKSNIIFSVLLVTFFISTVGAVGVIPTSYNSEAQSILGMLWRKLDEAIVSNYNARILVRYHDHEGSNPGDFTSRGLPIGTNGIEDAAITSSKVSSAVKTKTVSVHLGDYDGSESSDERAVWVAPGAGVINRVTLTTENAVTASDVNYADFDFNRRRSGGMASSLFVSSTEATGGSSFAAFTPVPFVVTSNQYATFQQNDVYTFYVDNVAAGVQMDDLLLTIEYSTTL